MLRGHSVFLSITSADLEPARKEAARVLTSLGFRVLSADDGPNRLRDMIARIGECDVFLQLVGLRYGQESPSGAAEFGRVSLGQHESLHAEKMGRETIYLLLDESFPCGPSVSEHHELSKMQHWYRQHLLSSSECHCVAHLREVESIIRSLPDVPCPPPRTPQTLLTNATLIVVSLGAIAWSTARLWAYGTDRLDRPTEPLTLADPRDATAYARAAKAMTKKRKMVQWVVDECVIPRSAVSPNPPEDVIEAAIARICADKPESIPFLRGVLHDYCDDINQSGYSSSAYEQALVHFVAKRFDQAATMAEKAAKIIASEREGGSPFDYSLRESQSDAFLLVGHARYMMQQFDQAISAYQQRASLFDRQSDPLPHANALNWAGTVLWKIGRYEDAERVLREVMNLREKNLPPDATPLIATINDFSAVLFKLRRYAEAEPLFRRALSIAERDVGKHPQTVAHCLENLSEALIATDRLAEAEAALRRALLIRAQQPSEYARQLADDLRGLALVLNRGRHYEEAESLLRQALPITEKALRPDHVTVAYTLNSLALVLQKTARATEAVPLLRRSLRIMEQEQGPDHTDTAVVHFNLAFALIFEPKLDEVLKHGQSAMRILEKYATTTGKEHPKAKLVSTFCLMLQEAGTMDEDVFKARMEILMREAESPLTQ